MSKKDFLITVIIVVLAIALIATIIVLKKLDAANPDETTGTTSGIAHDHDGDGVPDHGDEYHETEGGDNTTGTTEGGSTSGDSTSGGNTDTVVPDDSDIDISVDLEDLPTDGDGTTEDGSTGTTDGGSSGTTEGGSTEGGSTEGGSTEGGSSGAVSGNEIDFDDLLNRGQNGN